MEAIETVKTAWKKAIEPETKLAVSETVIADGVMQQIADQLSADADICAARSDVFNIVFKNGWLKEDQTQICMIELGRIMAEAYDKARKADPDKYVPLIFCASAAGTLGARFAEPKEDPKAEDKAAQLKKLIKEILAD